MLSTAYARLPILIKLPCAAYECLCCFTNCFLALDAEKFAIGEGESHIQLELTALIQPYIYVRRPDRSTVILQPDTDPVKCCALSHGDTIHFVETNTSIAVKMRLEDVQVASSAIEEPVVTADVITTRPAASLALEALGTPDLSNAVDQIIETPMSAAMPQSPERAESNADDEKELPESYLSNLDSPSRRPSVHTIVPSDSRKRPRDEDADFKANPSTKKSRTVAQDDKDPEVSANSCPDLVLKQVY